MSEEKKKKNHRSGKNIVVFSGGAAAFLAVAVYAFNKFINRKKVRGSNVLVNLPASEILKLSEKIIAKSKEVHDAVASVQLDEVTYENVVLPLAELEALQFPMTQSCIFPKMVSPFEDLREASAEAARSIDVHVSTCSKRDDVYRVVKAFALKGESMTPEAKHFTDILVRDFERNGLQLTTTERDELQRLKSQMDELSMLYMKNLNEDDAYIICSEIELAGLPLEFIILDNFEKDKFKIMLKSHHVSPILEHCKTMENILDIINLTVKVGSTRRKVAVANGRRCESNVSVLEKLAALNEFIDYCSQFRYLHLAVSDSSRHKIANLLDYENFADYATNIRMVKSSSKVLQFLDEMSTAITDLAEEELSMLEELKRKEEGESLFGMEDLPYYMKRYEEQELDLDFEAIKEYFPVNLVFSGIFKIFADLFGLRFAEVKNTEVWHNSVQLFSVFDLSSGKLLGHFYLDLYSRDGKYAQTCVLALQNNSNLKGMEQVPVALFLSQIQKETNGRPGLMRFPEVVNHLHEFGHVIHHLCNRASFVRFSGLRFDPDFFNVPSQLLENWCYEALALKVISGFHEDITKPLSDSTCNTLKRWRCSFSALKLKEEILYCSIDQVVHSTEYANVVLLFEYMHPRHMSGIPALDGANPASCFPRITIGNEATCYSQFLSEVFAADIFASKFHDDLFNQDTGIQFRNMVLAPGGSRDPYEILEDFLGREPSVQAFIKSRCGWSHPLSSVKQNE